MSRKSKILNNQIKAHANDIVHDFSELLTAIVSPTKRDVYSNYNTDYTLKRFIRTDNTVGFETTPMVEGERGGMEPMPLSSTRVYDFTEPHVTSIVQKENSKMCILSNVMYRVPGSKTGLQDALNYNDNSFDYCHFLMLLLLVKVKNFLNLYLDHDQSNVITQEILNWPSLRNNKPFTHVKEMQLDILDGFIMEGKTAMFNEMMTLELGGPPPSTLLIPEIAEFYRAPLINRKCVLDYKEIIPAVYLLHCWMTIAEYTRPIERIVMERGIFSVPVFENIGDGIPDIFFFMLWNLVGKPNKININTHMFVLDKWFLPTAPQRDFERTYLLSLDHVQYHAFYHYFQLWQEFCHCMSRDGCDLMAYKYKCRKNSAPVHGKIWPHPLDEYIRKTAHFHMLTSNVWSEARSVLEHLYPPFESTTLTPIQESTLTTTTTEEEKKDE